MDSNLGTFVSWKTMLSDTANNVIFERVFWTFSSSIEGFKHCKPVINIDGTFLTGKYKGKLQIAVSWDANNHVFPVAFAIMEEERLDTWSWFLTCIREYVTQRTGLCLLIDKHGGILSAVNRSCWWQHPNGYHRYSVRHLASNYHAKYNNALLQDMITSAAYENQKIKSIKDLNSKATDEFDRLPLELWALVDDGGKHYGDMTTNLSKSFNGVLKGARHLPIRSLVQLTFYKCVNYFQERCNKANVEMHASEVYSAYAKQMLTKWEKKSRGHSVRNFNMNLGIFDVQTAVNPLYSNRGLHLHVVNLMERTYDCQKWQNYKISCSHVIAVCKFASLDHLQYVDECYTLKAQMACYQHSFNLVVDAAYWREPNFPKLHPNLNLARTRGRPRTTRLQNAMDWRES
ncbi:uncharacterized protein LOC114321901 [Camellia sinensis]|uniref:uncharacterized protein LOC114321901 n=1 Tax=Camellia sinensis TaxID=4442 RepID=UPI00103556E1|nr:uncharacterized protein LOC114321901 [Camellia sinensis]